MKLSKKQDFYLHEFSHMKSIQLFQNDQTDNSNKQESNRDVYVENLFHILKILLEFEYFRCKDRYFLKNNPENECC